MYACPCCGQETLKTRSESEACPVCDFVDEGWTPDDETGIDNYFSLDDSRRLWNKYHKSMLEIVKLRSNGGTIGDEIVGTNAGKWHKNYAE